MDGQLTLVVGLAAAACCKHGRAPLLPVGSGAVPPVSEVMWVISSNKNNKTT
jgi:hypothetical protein